MVTDSGASSGSANIRHSADPGVATETSSVTRRAPLRSVSATVENEATATPSFRPQIRPSPTEWSAWCDGVRTPLIVRAPWCWCSRCPGPSLRLRVAPRRGKPLPVANQLWMPPAA